MLHLLEINVSQSMLRILIHTVNVDVWVNRLDWQGWTNSHVLPGSTIGRGIGNIHVTRVLDKLVTY